MKWQGVYFYLNPQTRETHFMEFYPDNQWINFKTQGFIVDFLLAKPLRTQAYTLLEIPIWSAPKGYLQESFLRLKRRKIDTVKIEFEWNNQHWSGLINPLDKQIDFVIKTKGKPSLYHTYTFLDKTTTTQAPIFYLGQDVSTIPERGHTYRKGLIYKYLWHYKRRQWIYFLQDEKGKYLSKWYFDKDLREN